MINVGVSRVEVASTPACGRRPRPASSAARIIDRDAPTVVVDIARAGSCPARLLHTLNSILNPAVVRQDHLIVARTTMCRPR
ncbi:MAG: hypothetical protein R3F43_06160 [bacterium]